MESTLPAGTLRANDVAARLGIGRSTFYKWQGLGIGPQPVIRQGRTALWSKAAVEAFIGGSKSHG